MKHNNVMNSASVVRHEQYYNNSELSCSVLTRDAINVTPPVRYKKPQHGSHKNQAKAKRVQMMMTEGNINENVGGIGEDDDPKSLYYSPAAHKAMELIEPLYPHQ